MQGPSLRGLQRWQRSSFFYPNIATSSGYSSYFLRPMRIQSLSNSCAHSPTAFRPIWAGCPPGAAGLRGIFDTLEV